MDKQEFAVGQYTAEGFEIRWYTLEEDARKCAQEIAQKNRRCAFLLREIAQCDMTGPQWQERDK